LPSGLVTFLFTDIEGSTRLARMLGGGYRPVLLEHRRILVGALSKGGGIPLFTEGDSVFVAFAHASEALLACAAAQHALAAHAWPTPEARPSVRMGMHTGQAVPVGGEYASPEVHRAARIATAAHGGQVLCSEATMLAAGAIDGGVTGEGTWMLDLGLHRLRGFDDRERLYQLVAPGLERRFPRPRTLATSPHNLPGVATSFIGRVTERRALADLLGANRLVSVVGPGGAGKTRLALEVAGDFIAAYPDGVWFTDLAAVTDPGLVAVSVAATLGLRPEPGRAVLDTLREFTADRRCLLVLDTCDAQPGAIAMLVNRVLSSGTSTSVLATSREPLNLPGEVVWRIPPLSQAAGPDGTPSEAVTLLLERTAASRGGRTVDGGELAQLSQIARHLDGLPLALELAAARLRMLSATELADRLDVNGDGLDIGLSSLQEDTAAGRHATIQATVSWSYRTLGTDAATLLRRLSVFAGPVDLPAVEWLTNSDPIGPLAVLVDKSLVAAEPTADGMVYRMLDPIRAYAARRLTEEGEALAAYERHVAWSRHEVERIQCGPDGRPVTLSIYAIDPLADEIRSALKWSVTRGCARDGLALARGLDQWWRERGLAREGRLWLFRLYERIAATGETVPDAELAAAYHMHSLHAGADGEHLEALRFAQRAEVAARRTEDNGLVARVRAGHAMSLLEHGDLDAAEQACREVVSWAEANAVAHEAFDAVCCLAQLLWRRGATGEAAELLAAARQLEAVQPAERGRRKVDMTLGMVALSRGDVIAAHEHLVVALRSRMTFGFHSGACETVNALAARCALGGDPITAARLFGAAQAAQVWLRGANVLFAPFWIEQQTRVRQTLGDRVFDDVYAQGTTLTLDQAVAVALSVDHPDMADGSERFSDVDVTTVEIVKRLEIAS
jgi:predicted ATPase/class 3 adenylate cyclase